MKISKLFISQLFFAAWVILWLNFTCRELFKAGNLKDYRILLSRDQEGRRAYVYGEDFYALLKAFKADSGPGATYMITGVEKYSLEERRAAYYLYPCLKSDDPDYILVYNSPYTGEGYKVLNVLDGKRLILKKKAA